MSVTSGPDLDRRPPAPLTLRATLLVLFVGLVVAAVATAGTGVTLLRKSSTYTAKAALVLLPPSGEAPDDDVKISDLLTAGGPAAAAADVFSTESVQDAASRAAGVPATAITMAAVTATDPAEVDLTVTAPSAQEAEGAAQAAIDAATPLVQTVSGPYKLTVVGSPAGSAVPTGLAVSTVMLFVFPIALLLAVLVGLGARQVYVRRQRGG